MQRPGSFKGATNTKLYFGLLQVLNFMTFAVFISVRCTVGNKNFMLIDGTIRILKVIIYMIAAVFFLIIAYKLYNKLLEVSLQKAKMMKGRLALSICFFCIPLILKALFNVIYV